MILTPSANMWASALKSLFERGEITLQQMELSLKRLYDLEYGEREE